LEIDADRRPQISSETLKLLTRGRKTGLPHIALIRYVYTNGAFYVIAGRKKSDWASNALSSKEATVRLGDYAQFVRCEQVHGSSEEVLSLFQKKYGKRVVSGWYTPSELCLKLAPTGPLQLRGRIKGESESLLDLASWKKKGRNYYSTVSEAFDSASDEYDFTIRQNFINVWIRNRSIKELMSIIRPNDTLLEVGCGTGVEAIEISRQVRGIVATDISSKMLSILDRKIMVRNLTGKIEPVRLGAWEIRGAGKYLPKGKVRVAYSFNGALNCEPRIREFPAELWKIMEPGGLFLCSIRNTFCLSESITHAAVLQLDRMAPRKKQPVMVSVGGVDIPSYYYAPGGFAKLFEPYFKSRKMIGLPGLMPPAYLSSFYVKLRRALFFLESAERAFASHYPVNRLGDQTLILFERVDHPFLASLQRQ
jgi:SAM-dependent methyltransferase